MYWIAVVCTTLVILESVEQVAGIACNSYVDQKFGPVCPFDCTNCGTVTCRDNDYVCVSGYCVAANGAAGPQGCAFEEIARGKNVAQMSKYNDLGPYRATNRIYAADVVANCAHTDTRVGHPWWRVDFGGQHVVYAVQLYNRIHRTALDRLSFFDIRVGNTDIKTAVTAGQKFTGNLLCKTYNQRVPETLNTNVKPYAEILCDQPRRGRYLSIQMNEGNGISRGSGYNKVLTICEISIRGYKDFGSGGRTGNGDCWCRDGKECDMAGVCNSGCQLRRYGDYCHKVVALEDPTLSAYSTTTVKVQWKLFNSNQLTLIDSNRGSVLLSYRVQYRPAAGDAWQDFSGQSSIIGSGANQFRTLTLTGLRADTQYQIRSVLVKTYSGNPEIVSRSTAVTRCAVPAPVSNIRLTTGCDEADKASITVTWLASSSVRCGTGSVEYVVWVKEGPAGSGTFGTHRLQNSGYVIRNLKQATLYTVRVEARNSAYPGLKSLVDQSLTTTDGVPSAPENVHLSPSYSTTTGTWPNRAKIVVTWQRPANVGCGTPRYRVTYGLSGATGETIYGLDATTRTLLDLVPYTEYKVTVTIVSGGVTADAQSQTIRTAEGQSSPVTDIQFSATSTTSTTVSWTKPAKPYGIITKYLVTYRRQRYLVSGATAVNCPAGSGQAKTVPVSSGTSVHLTGLESNARYNIAVVPNTNGGSRAGIGSNLNVDTLSAAVPRPRQIRASPLYDGTLPHPNQCKATVNWAVDIGNDCMVLQFRVDHTPSNGQKVSSGVLSGVTRSLIISSLKCYTNYEVRVVALSGSAESESEPYDFETPEGIPGRVSSLTITPSPNSAVLSWSAPTPHGVLSQYQITYRREKYLASCPSNDQTKYQTVAAGTTTDTVTGLSSYSEYRFSVTAYTNNNQSKGLITWQTKQTTKKAPPRPTITKTESQYVPTYTYPNTAKITVEWSQPAPDAVECMTITNHVHYRQPGTVLTIDAGMNSRAYDVPNLIPYTNYEVRIEGRSGQGVRSFTGWKMLRTAEGLSGPVTSLSVSPSGTTVDVSWGAPSHPYGVITSYRVSYSRQSYLAGCTNNPGHADTEDVDPDPRTLTGLSPFSQYQVEVAAINGAGPGQESSRVVDTLDTVPDSSAAPTKAIVYAETTSATVQFNDISCKQKRGVFKAYNYELTDVSYGRSSRSGDVSTIDLSLTGLTPFTSYNIRYNWANQKGASDWSEEVEFVTEKSTPPAPTITTVDSGPRYMNVTVEPPYPPYDYLTSVTVTCRRTDNNQEITNQITIIDNSKEAVVVSFDEVQPSTEYFCTAVVIGSLSVSSNKSKEMKVSTTESEASEPREFKAMEITSSSMRLTWTSPEAKNGLILRYKYWCKAKSTKNPSVRDSLPDAVKFESTKDHAYTINEGVLEHKTDPINDLWSATQYECHVWAVNGWGPGKTRSRTFWTKAEPVTVPVGSRVKYDPARSNDSSVYVTLPKIPSPNVEIERHQILVKRIPQNGGSNRRKRSVDRDLTFEEAEDLGADNYTAAEWNDSRDSFLVGDGQNYSDYYNAPLEKGETYDILYRAASVVGEDVEYTEYISLSSHVKVGHYPQPFPVGIVAGSVAGAIFFLLILAAVIIVFVVLSRKGMLPSMPPRARSDSNAKIIDGTELAPVVVVEDRVDSPLPNGEVHTDTPPVTVPRYERHFQPYTLEGFMTTIRDLTKQPRGFTQEYQALPNHAGHYPQSVAKIQENRRKNRYQDIIPYDHNRIVLSGDDCDDDISNYINASYVTDYKGRRTYIASQGPKTGITVDDFWQMIWQEDVRVIVMATDCFERGREKCAEYWPTNVGASLIYGNYEVEHQSTTEVNENVKKRQFVISKGGTLRTITQFQYVGWPDHGVPPLCAPILRLRAIVREAIEPDTVTLVHCSAGVGRTGTFMAVDDCLSEYNDTKKFNIKETLTRFRHFRERTVQTDRQYAYVYHCLLEALALPDTDVPKQEFIDRVNKHGISEREFEILEIFRGLDMGEECQGRLEENIHKNRFPDIIPDDYNRAALTEEMAGRNLYLNACYMDNLSHSPSLLATQMTLEHTILELWRLVRDYGITLFVRMDGDHVDDPNDRYWPLKGSMSVPPFTIEFRNRENLHKDYSLETFAVTFGNNTWSVRMLVFHGWPGSALTLPPLQAMINLYQALKQQQGESRQAVIVQCFNGATKSGLLGATYSLLDALQVQDTISVFKATRIIHTTRPQFIPDMEHYSFLHSVVCHVLQPSQEEEESIYENQLPAAEFADDEDLYENVPRKPLPRES